jgi:hypothetical protein
MYKFLILVSLLTLVGCVTTQPEPSSDVLILDKAIQSGCVLGVLKYRATPSTLVIECQDLGEL